MIADRAYDARKLRDWLTERGCEAVIPPNPTRKHPHPYDPEAYKQRNLIERMFCRLKDFRRIATRYDKRVDTFLSAILIAATLDMVAQLSPDPRTLPVFHDPGPGASCVPRRKRPLEDSRARK